MTTDALAQAIASMQYHRQEAEKWSDKVSAIIRLRYGKEYYENLQSKKEHIRQVHLAAVD